MDKGCARIYIRVEARKISLHIKQKILVWHHLQTTNKYLNNKPTAKDYEKN